MEIDEQQVNLTRFNLFFRRSVISSSKAAGSSTSRGGPSTGPMTTAALSDTPYLFYSRQIGLNRNREVPIIAGGRLTGKVGEYAVGVMNIETGEETVSRSADQLHRHPRQARHPAPQHDRCDVHESIGVDGRRRVEPGIRRRRGVFLLRERRDGRTTRAPRPTASRAIQKVTRAASNSTTTATVRKPSALKIGDVFNPEVGFVRRDDIRRSFGLLRFSPRPARRESPSILNAVRKFTWEAGLEYILNGADSLETRQQTGRFNIEFNSSDQFTVEVNRNYELLVLPFTIGGVVVPPGGYNFDDVLLSCAGPAAPRLRHDCAAGRRVLRRDDHLDQLHVSPRVVHEALFARARYHGELGGSSRR